MKIIVKNVYQREEIFEVNLEDPLSVLASLIKERFNYENNVKIIYKYKKFKMIIYKMKLVIINKMKIPLIYKMKIPLIYKMKIPLIYLL